MATENLLINKINQNVIFLTTKFLDAELGQINLYFENNMLHSLMFKVKTFKKSMNRTFFDKVIKNTFYF